MLLTLFINHFSTYHIPLLLWGFSANEPSAAVDREVSFIGTSPRVLRQTNIFFVTPLLAVHPSFLDTTTDILFISYFSFDFGCVLLKLGVERSA